MSKYGLDKFYTLPNIVDNVLSKINLDFFKTIIEPSAGSGSFSRKIPGVLAYDIAPEDDSIIEQDFLKLYGEFKSPVLIVGNPPFGKNGSLALSFIKKSSEFADTIAFILPRSFKKQSFYDKIPLSFWKIHEEDIPDNSFSYNGEVVDVRCVFQIYEKRIEKREKVKIEQPDFFSFVKKESAKLSVRRIGAYAGEATTDFKNKSTQSHYFIDTENPDDFVKMINSIEWEHNNTVGAESISKPELIEKILDKIKM
jgi:hypothetical protein